MEINKLRAFVDLAKTLSFSETAENLYTSQSTISKQIKGLEKELGETLTDEELRAMIEEFDLDGDGEINENEFIAICTDS